MSLSARSLLRVRGVRTSRILRERHHQACRDKYHPVHTMSMLRSLRRKAVDQCHTGWDTSSLSSELLRSSQLWQTSERRRLVFT
jgi:hypothetical protein